MGEEQIESLSTKCNVTLTATEVSAMLGIMERRQYERGTQIEEIGHKSQHLYLVENGVVRQYYYKNGRDVTEHFTGNGDLAFSIESLFLHRQSMLGMEAVDDCTLWLINYEQFKQLTDIHEGIRHLLIAIFEQDLVLTQRKADSWRFESSHERYERFCQEYPQAARKASIAHIASYLLMAPETLSRVRAGTL